MLNPLEDGLKIEFMYSYGKVSTKNDKIII